MSHKLSPALLLACLFIALSAVVGARAEPLPPATQSATALSADQARRALETLQDDQKRAQMIDTLRAIAGASAQPQAPAPTQKLPVPLSADSLGAQLLLSVSEEIGEISRQVAEMARTLTHFPAFYYWIMRTANDPAAYNLLIEIA